MNRLEILWNERLVQLASVAEALSSMRCVIAYDTR